MVTNNEKSFIGFPYISTFSIRASMFDNNIIVLDGVLYKYIGIACMKLRVNNE